MSSLAPSLRGRQERQVSPPAVSQPHAPPLPGLTPASGSEHPQPPTAGTKSQAVTSLNGRGREAKAMASVLCVFPGQWGRLGPRLFSPQGWGLHCPPMRLPALPSVRPPVQPRLHMFMELPLCSGCCPGTLSTARPSQVLLCGTDQRRTAPPHLFTPENPRWRQGSPDVPVGDSTEPAVGDLGSRPVAISYQQRKPAPLSPGLPICKMG